MGNLKFWNTKDMAVKTLSRNVRAKTTLGICKHDVSKTELFSSSDAVHNRS